MELEEYLEKRYTSGTAKVYKNTIAQFLQDCPEAESYQYAQVVDYLQVLRKRFSNVKTVHRCLASIKAYYQYLLENGKRNTHPAQSIRLRDTINRDIQLSDLFSMEELEGLIEARKERYPALETRNKVLMSLLVCQALQTSEIANLKTTDIDLTKGEIRIKGTRTTSGRILALKASQILLLQGYTTTDRIKLTEGRVKGKSGVNGRKTTGKITQTLLVGLRGEDWTKEDISKHVIRSYKGFYGSRKINCQTIRQSVLKELLKAGNDLRQVQLFAGHKYPGSTEQYRRKGLEELSGAVQLLHPMK